MAAEMKFTLHSIVHPEMHVIARQLECAVCLQLVTDPVQTDCGHIFCRECVRPVVVCPACREPMAVGSAKPLHECNKPMTRMIHNLKVFCPHHSRTPSSADGEPEAKRPRVQGGGCGWEGSYSDLLAKHVHECPLQVVPCPRGCGESMRRKDLAEHESVCTKNFVQCQICQELVKPGQMAAHRKAFAELHVQFLEAKLQCKDAVSGQESLLSSLISRLTEVETSLKSNAKTQHMTKMMKDRADEVKKMVRDAMDEKVSKAVKTLEAQWREKFVWEIPDVERLKREHPRGMFIYSPEFTLRGVPFRLEFYPCGRPEGGEDKCAMFLHSKNQLHRSKVILDVNDARPHTVEEDDWKKGWGKDDKWPIPSATADSDTVRLRASMISTEKLVRHSYGR